MRLDRPPVCLRCRGTGAVGTGEYYRGQELGETCDRCGGDGERRCEVDGCMELATDLVDAVGGLCKAHAEADYDDEGPVASSMLSEGDKLKG